MKDTLNTALSFALAIAIGGSVFKLLHWQGANVLLIAGFGSVAVCGVLKALIDVDIPSKLGGLATCFLALGFLFTLLHWYGIVGTVMFGIALVSGVASIFLAKKDE